MIPVRAIFISYRRDDSEGQAGRLYDDLARQFGDQSVFMDVTAIEPGLDFRKVIDKNVASCGVLLAVIGPAWLDAKDETGLRRLDNPMDFVRLETAAALKRDIPVVPVLVRGARMPRSEQLPDDLKELAYRNGLELTHARWDSDVEVLIKALKRQEGNEKGQPVEVKVESPLPAAPVETRKVTSSPTGSVPEEPVNKSRRVIVGGIAGAILLAIVVGTWFHVRSNLPNKATQNQGQPAPVQPVIRGFEATPTQVPRGDRVTISWELTSADDVELEPFGQVDSSGRRIEQPQQTTTYKLNATNKSGGKITRSLEVFVKEPRAEEQSVVRPSNSLPGTVKGRVTYVGTPVNPKPIDMSQDPACKGTNTAEPIVADGGNLANVFVYVKEGLGNRTFEVPKEAVTIDQQGCKYRPHVLGVMTGQNIEIKNDDSTTHNIHPMPQVNREWNVSQPPQGAPFQKSFALEEIMLPVKCNQHPWMRMYVNVVKSPFYAVTGPDGRYEIKGLPPGDYTIAFVHERLGYQTQRVTLNAKETKTVDQTFKAQ
jgi:plastocyanin